MSNSGRTPRENRAPAKIRCHFSPLTFNGGRKRNRDLHPMVAGETCCTYNRVFPQPARRLVMTASRGLNPLAKPALEIFVLFYGGPQRILLIRRVRTRWQRPTRGEPCDLT